MVLAGRTLFVAGPQDVADELQAFYKPDDAENRSALDKQDSVLEDRQGAVLYAVSASNGEQLAEYKLDSLPVWDGMAAANGRLFLATKSGKVLCFDKQ
jgi:outer membrane protein assembly factor BamB